MKTKHIKQLNVVELIKAFDVSFTQSLNALPQIFAVNHVEPAHTPQRSLHQNIWAALRIPNKKYLYIYFDIKCWLFYINCYFVGNCKHLIAKKNATYP